MRADELLDWVVMIVLLCVVISGMRTKKESSCE